jgi:hypothetical protein
LASNVLIVVEIRLIFLEENCIDLMHDFEEVLFKSLINHPLDLSNGRH